MKTYFQNDKGLSLVEILAALVILSIALITFFSFFTQSAKFTNHNKEKLTAVQVAEDVVGKIRPITEINELDEYGFQLIDGAYLNSSSYPNYIVKVMEEDGPLDNIKKTIITVTSNSSNGIKTSFETEMYFEVSDEE